MHPAAGKPAGFQPAKSRIASKQVRSTGPAPKPSAHGRPPLHDITGAHNGILFTNPINFFPVGKGCNELSLKHDRETQAAISFPFNILRGSIVFTNK
jgi:hypothetical protein